MLNTALNISAFLYVLKTEHAEFFHSMEFLHIYIHILYNIILCYIMFYYNVMMLKLGRFGQQIRNTWKVLKCGAGEGWR